MRSAPPPPCPVPRIVDGLDTKVQTTGKGATAVAWRAAVLGFKGGCAYDSEGVRLQLDLDLTVTPGPEFGAQTRRVELPYFVAVADPTGTIVDKQVFIAGTDVAASTSTTIVTEKLEQRIRGVDVTTAPLWRVFFGFELPRAEALERRSGK